MRKGSIPGLSPWLGDDCLLVFSHPLPNVCVSLSFFFMRTPVVMGQGPLNDPILMSQPVKTFSPIEGTS